MLRRNGPVSRAFLVVTGHPQRVPTVPPSVTVSEMAVWWTDRRLVSASRVICLQRATNPRDMASAIPHYTDVTRSQPAGCRKKHFPA